MSPTGIVVMKLAIATCMSNSFEDLYHVCETPFTICTEGRIHGMKELKKGRKEIHNQ